MFGFVHTFFLRGGGGDSGEKWGRGVNEPIKKDIRNRIDSPI